MKNTFLKKVARPLLLAGEVCLLTGVTVFSAFPLSCKATTSGIEIIGVNYTVPTLQNYSVISSNELVLEFSEEVTLLSGVVSPFIPAVSDSDEHSSNESLSPSLFSATGIDGKIPIELNYGEDKKTVNVIFAEKTDIGKKYKFYGEVENKKGASLTFAVSFVGYNNRVPDLLLSEIHDGMVKATTYGTYGVNEYVEYIVLSDGNLAGLVSKTASNPNESAFAFPSIEVSAGDYITIHYGLTKEQEDLCISETTGDKTLSSANGSHDSAWDFWIDTSSSIIGGTQDIITLENINTGEILQALLYSVKDRTDWTAKVVKSISEKITDYEIWKPTTSVPDAFWYEKSTLYGIQRTNIAEIIEAYNAGEIEYPIPSDKSEWAEIGNPKLTPGYQNSL